MNLALFKIYFCFITVSYLLPDVLDLVIKMEQNKSISSNSFINSLGTKNLQNRLLLHLLAARDYH